MGNATSKGGPEQTYRESFLGALPYNGGARDIFYTNKFMYLFENPKFDEPKKYINTVYKASELKDILIACRENIPDVKNFIEAMFNTKDYEDEPFLRKLESEFRFHSYSAELRREFLNAYSQFKAVFIADKPLQRLESFSRAVSFPEIMSSVDILIDMIERKSVERESLKHLQEVGQSFSNSIPINSLQCPSSESFIQSQATLFSLESIKVCPRGITSNGMFLFVITENKKILIFSLKNALALSEPHVASINEQLYKEDSCYATSTYLFIVSNVEKTVFKYSISELVSSPEERPVFGTRSINSQGIGAFYSDGIVVVTLMKNRKLSITNNKGKTKIINLNKGKRQFLALEDDLFTSDCKELIAVTNGSFIGMVSKLENSSTLFRVFDLNTGSHVVDEIQDDLDIYGICYDTYNNCYFAMTKTDQGKILIKTLFYKGSVNRRLLNIRKYKIEESSESEASNFLFSLSRITSSYVNSRISPKEFIGENDEEDIKIIIKILNRALSVRTYDLESIYKIKDSLISSLAVILCLNISSKEEKHEATDEIFNLIANLSERLPVNLTCLIFFGNCKYFLKMINEQNINFLVNLFLMINSKLLKLFAISNIEKCSQLAKIPITTVNRFSELLSNNATIPLQLRTLFIVHSNILINESLEILMHNPFVEVEMNEKKRGDPYNHSPLDNLCDYIQVLVTKADSIVSLYFQNEIQQDDPFITFFTNMIHSISCLVSYHSLARYTLALFSMVLTKLNHSFAAGLQRGRTIQKLTFDLLFIYTKLASTLVVGGGMSEFEENNMWIIKENINLIKEKAEKLASMDLSDIDHEILDFIEKGSLEEAYKYKAGMNKKLSPEVKRIDRICFAALCKHSNLIELLRVTEVTPQLKKVMDQVIRTRNNYRSMNQNKDEKSLQQLQNRAIMLLRLNSSFTKEENPLILVSNFINSKYDTDVIKAVIIGQKTRIQTTLAGFALIEKTFSEISNNLLNQIMAFALSKIDNFEGFAMILRTNDLSESQKAQVKSFLALLMSQINKTENNGLTYLVFKFFRDMTMLDELREEFLTESINILHKNSNVPLYSLVYYLSMNCKRIPPNIDLAKAKYDEVAFTCELLKEENPEIISVLTERFFSCENSIEMRVFGRALVTLLRKSIELLPEFLKRLFMFMGENFKYMRMNSEVAEAASIARKFYEWEETSEVVNNFISREYIERDNEIILAGIFIMIGTPLESIRPFCDGEYTWRGFTTSCIISPTKDKEKFICYPRIFSVEESPKIIELKQTTSIHAVQRIPLNKKSFNQYKFLVSAYSKIDSFHPFAQMLLSQAILSLSNDQLFTDLFNDEQLLKMSSRMMVFNNAQEFVKRINDVQNMPRLPMNGVFSTLKCMNSEYKSFISPIIDSKIDSFSVEIRCNSTFNGFVGIVSSPTEKFLTTWRFLSIPDGKIYPEDVHSVFVKNNQLYQMKILPKQRKFQVNEGIFDFPEGETFRVFIGTKVTMKFDIISEEGYDIEATNAYNCPAFVVNETCKPIYSFPESIEHFNDSLPKNIESIPKEEVKTESIDINEKQKYMFAKPPREFPIHIGFAAEASDSIIEDEIKTCLMRLADISNTITIMRILTNTPNKLPIQRVAQLFSLVSSQLEPFNLHNFLKGYFPFQLSKPTWEIEPHTTINIEKECINFLKIITKDELFSAEFGKELEKMVNDPTIHLVTRFNKFHHFYPNKEEPSIISTTCPYSVLSINSLSNRCERAFRIGNNIYPSSIINTRQGEVEIMEPTKGKQISNYEVSSYSLEWIFGSPFEIMLLIKNYIYFCKTAEQQYHVRNMALDLFNCRSPIIAPFVPQLIDFVFIMVPSNPLIKDKKYINRLLTMGSILNTQNNETLKLVYSHEHQIFTSKFAAETATHFPEFFNANLPKPESPTVKIKIQPVDPGAVKESPANHMQLLRTLSHRYTSLSGFPFWKILPLWFRLSGFMSHVNDVVPPAMYLLPDNIIQFTNPSELVMRIKITPKCRLPNDTMIVASNTSFFEDQQMIVGNQISEVIATGQSDLFLSLVSDNAVWDMFDIDLNIGQTLATTEEEIEINANEIHDKFISEMTAFAVDWTEGDTQTLLSCLPRSALNLATFATVESIARKCELVQKYQPTVVALKALIIHHFNYFRSKKLISPHIESSMSFMISCEDAADEILRHFLKTGEKDFPLIYINRKAARKWMSEGVGSKRNSIIHQMTTIFNQLKPENLRCPSRPWRVTFIDEEAIDEGGPARELITEIAEAIFDPSSGVTIPTPNGREKKNEFVPIIQEQEDESLFHTIGVYIGMILRLNLPQELPFAQFVWNFLSGKQVKSSDILEVDNSLKQHFDRIKSFTAESYMKECQVQWRWEHWSGKISLMPGHTTENIPFNMVDTYINEYIGLRINELMPALRLMKEGFNKNIGFSEHHLMTGSLLSHMAQGSSIITARQIRQATKVSNGYESIKDQPIRFFFEALEMMTPEQLIHLLKFVTTLTRLPNTSKFCFLIDKLVRDDPDNSLPTASTCFNKLHLPAYTCKEICYKRIITAISFCSTMEIK